MNIKINIAIDGLSSTGKSTLAKALAREIDYVYIDSGAMYRAISLYLLDHDIDITEKNADLNDALANIDITFVRHQTVLNGRVVEEDIRSMRVSNVVSQVAAIPLVRDFSVRLQQDYGKQKGVVMDGRDIGTVVFPDAELKIFLLASEKVRVQRRYDELIKKGQAVTIEEVRGNLLERDRIDSTRAYNPLRKAADARELDNSFLTVADQVEKIKTWLAKILQSSH